MAEEFKVNPRQATEKANTLPKTDVYSKFSAAMGGIADFAGGLAVNAAVEKAAIQGAEERLQGKQVKLKPGITKATEAYNKSYDTMDKNIVYAETLNKLDRAKHEALAPGKFDIQSAGKNYQAKANEIIGQGISGASERNKNALAFELKMRAANNELAIDDYGRTYAFSEAKQTNESTREMLLTDIRNHAQDGNRESFDESFAKYEQQLSSSVASGFMTQAESDVLQAEMENASIESFAMGEGERAAIEGPGVVEAKKNEMAQLLKKGEYTAEQYDVFMSAYTKGANLRQSMMHSQQNLNKSQAEYEIQDGSIASEEQLAKYRNKVTANDYWSLKSDLLRQQQREAKTLEGMNEFRQNAALDNGLQTKAKEAVKNAAFAQDIELARKTKAQATKDPDAQVTPQEMAQIVASYNTPIPAWDAMQTAAILSNDYNRALPFLQGYKYQKANSQLKQKSTSIGLKGDAATIADMYNQMSPAVEDAAIEYQSIVNAVRKKDDIQTKERMRHYTKEIKEGEKRKIFKEQTGFDALENEPAYSDWKNIAGRRFGEFGENYRDQNFKSATDQMGNRWQPSRYGEPGVLQQNPIEAVSDMTRYGQLLDNYVNETIWKSVQANKALPEDERVGQKIEWAYKTPFPRHPSEREMVDRNIMYDIAYKEERASIYDYDKFHGITSDVFASEAKKPEVFLNGERAEVIIVTGAFTVQGDKPVAKLYLRNATSGTVPWYDAKQPDGIAQITLEPAIEVIPNTIKNASERSIVDQANEIGKSKAEGPKQSMFKEIFFIPSKVAWSLQEGGKLEKEAKKELEKTESKKALKELRAKRAGPSEVKTEAVMDEIANG